MKVLKAKPFQDGNIVKKHNELDSEGNYVQFVKPKGVDIIPAILQPGELVVNKANVGRVLKLIDLHNEKAPSKEDIVIPGMVDDGEQSESGDIYE